MLTVNIDPILIHLGPVAISWYGIAVAVAILVGYLLTQREARRKGLPGEAITELVLWVIIGGLMGARLLHVIDHWPFYATHPTQILAVHNGDLAILGAILGGAAAGGLVAWRRGLPVRRLFDAAAPGIVLGQAIGRLGSLMTGDALGQPTGGSWGIVYLHPGAMAPQLGVAYHPQFHYGC
jgi:phosphatidylglycerol:prolipoprotein diacylglycerol transferase